ncbi:MAG TPA: [NiFe]-hydrogenase assembly chaperone HybE [Burkholderiaceae bacterium]|nr:[NiFe]-hydrogenase assembly chaperone HybE [Burkholderiaceae bacterium]
MTEAVAAAPAAARRLQQAFVDIAQDRMAGLPMVHPDVGVEAVGFAPHPGPDGEEGWLGVLITSWCMNLVWIPATPDAARSVASPGATRLHALGDSAYAFIGSHEAIAGHGRFEACSLFSPMSDFADHAAARAVADEILRSLRKAAQQAGGEQAATARETVETSRRRFLFGGARP